MNFFNSQFQYVFKIFIFLEATLILNFQLKPFRLDMDSVCEKGTASVIETCIGGIRCESLSLRDNNFEGEMQVEFAS